MIIKQHSVEKVDNAKTLRCQCGNCGYLTEHVLFDQPIGIGVGIPFTKRPFWSSHKAYYLVCPSCSWANRVDYAQAQLLIREEKQKKKDGHSFTEAMGEIVQAFMWTAVMLVAIPLIIMLFIEFLS